MIKHEFRHGQALVLIGPQGCGKTVTARTIAAAYGPAAETNLASVLHPFELGSLLSDEPRTVIVEGLPETAREIHAVKRLITTDVIAAQRKGLKPKMVKTPNFIFCSGDDDAWLVAPSDRRFFVVRMPARQEAA